MVGRVMLLRWVNRQPTALVRGATPGIRRPPGATAPTYPIWRRALARHPRLAPWATDPTGRVLREHRRGRALFRRLLERVRQLDQLRLATCRPGEADVVRSEERRV